MNPYKSGADSFSTYGDLYHGKCSITLLVNDDLHMNGDLFVASGSDPVSTFQAV